MKNIIVPLGLTALLAGCGDSAPYVYNYEPVPLGMKASTLAAKKSAVKKYGSESTECGEKSYLLEFACGSSQNCFAVASDTDSGIAIGYAKEIKNAFEIKIHFLDAVNGTPKITGAYEVKAEGIWDAAVKATEFAILSTTCDLDKMMRDLAKYSYQATEEDSKKVRTDLSHIR